jgi:hypothetical protein
MANPVRPALVNPFFLVGPKWPIPCLETRGQNRSGPEVILRKKAEYMDAFFNFESVGRAHKRSPKASVKEKRSDPFIFKINHRK